MNDNELHNIVYSKGVIEFVTVANEFCLYLEKNSEKNAKDLLLKLQKFLPLIYLKAS